MSKKMSIKEFRALRGEYDLRKVAVPYSRVGDLVTISDEALEAMKAAPLVTSIEVTGQDVLRFLTDAELGVAEKMGAVAFLGRPVGENFMAAKRRYFGLETRA